MKAKEKTSMRTMSIVELTKLIVEAQKKLAQFKINRYSKQSKNVREGRGLQRKIAIASTLRAEKELHHE